MCLHYDLIDQVEHDGETRVESWRIVQLSVLERQFGSRDILDETEVLAVQECSELHIVRKIKI